MPGIFRILLLSLISLSTAVATADKLALSHRRHLANGNVQDKAVAKPYLISARPNGHTRPRTLSNAAEIASGTQDIYDRLVAAPARNAGRIEKAAVLPLAKYDVEHFDRNPFREWVRNTTLGALSPLSTPPISYRCGIFYNLDYKILFLRNRKAASTSIKKAIINALPIGQAMMRLDPSALQSTGFKSFDAMWRDYTVISSVRNPWARAASGFDFTYRQWTKKSDSCRQPSFLQFSRDPMIMGRLSNMMGCAVNRSATRNTPDEWEYDFFHVEPAFHCLFENGKPVVDYLVRYEHLDEDIEGMFTLLNERVPKGLPKLAPHKSVPWVQKGTTWKAAKEEQEQGSIISSNSSSTSTGVNDGDRDDEGVNLLAVHAQKYRECGMQCVHGIGKFFAVDRQLLGFALPSAGLQ